MVIPRIILGGKKEDINADDILASRISITPEGPYIISNVATSLHAIFLADFGLFGVFILPFIMLASMPIRLAQVGLLLRNFHVFVRVHKNPCKSTNPLGRQSSTHCQNPTLARIAG